MLATLLHTIMLLPVPNVIACVKGPAPAIPLNVKLEDALLDAPLIVIAALEASVKIIGVVDADPNCTLPVVVIRPSGEVEATEPITKVAPPVANAFSVVKTGVLVRVAIVTVAEALSRMVRLVAVFSDKLVIVVGLVPVKFKVERAVKAAAAPCRVVMVDAVVDVFVLLILNTVAAVKRFTAVIVPATEPCKFKAVKLVSVRVPIESRVLFVPVLIQVNVPTLVFKFVTLNVPTPAVVKVARVVSFKVVIELAARPEAVVIMLLVTVRAVALVAKVPITKPAVPLMFNAPKPVSVKVVTV